MSNETLKLLNEIEDYIKFLVYEKKLEICLCDSSLPIEYLQKLSLYTTHANAYCQKIKNKKNGQRHCLLMQKFVRRKCQENVPFIGTCYAGVCEFIFPIFDKESYLGFISVSGYKSSKNHSNNPPAPLKSMPNLEEIQPILAPLVNCIRLLYRLEQTAQKEQEPRGQDLVYQKIHTFLLENFLQKLSLTEISKALHYSPSYLAHLFQEKSGTPIMRYILTLKIQKAKELLQTTDMSVSQISEAVGFNDSNYFTATFKKNVGISPKQYRNL